MRKLLVIILLLAVAALQLGSRWMVYAAFKANQAYIARELCENKAKPELECEGQCCLKKQLQKTEEQESKAPRLLEVEVAACTLPQPLVVAIGGARTWAHAADARLWAPATEGETAGVATAVWQPPRV